MLKQPSSVVKMTNVATIRYKINNRYFEIACYPSKVVNWREGVEQDLSEVLQIAEVYENASHGTLAKKQDLARFFPDKSKLDIIRIILERGELQVSDKERDAQQSELFAEIVKIVVEKCVHPHTRRRFTPQTIRQAMKDIHFPIRPEQTAKKQALDCIKALQKVYFIDRAQMRLRLTYPPHTFKLVQERLLAFQIDINHISNAKNQSKPTLSTQQPAEKYTISSEEVSQPTVIIELTKEPINENGEEHQLCTKVFDIEPSKYREIIDIKQIPGVTVQVLIGTVVNSEYHGLEEEQFSILQLRSAESKAEKVVQVQKAKITKTQIVKQKVLKCLTCGESATFSNAGEQRQHFKTEWHVENVKRKSKNVPFLTAEEYKIQQFNRNYK